MPERGVIELCAGELPLREVQGHEGEETVVVITFDEMDELVDDNIFPTMGRLFGELEV